MNIEQIITELAMREFAYCKANGLELWLTVEQAATLIEQDDRLNVAGQDELQKYALLLVATFNDFTTTHLVAQVNQAHRDRQLGERIRQLVHQHLGDDWTEEGHHALTAAFHQLVNAERGSWT